MQVKFLLGALAGLVTVLATTDVAELDEKRHKSSGYDDSDSDYGHKHKRKGYGHDDSDYGHKKHGYGHDDSDYGYGDSSDDGYGHHGHHRGPTYSEPTYVPYKNHYEVDHTAPYPYTYFTSHSKKHELSVPKLGSYHCFLTGAPWTTCGRKTLTNYFLDQCLVFYVQMSANVNGICGGKPPKPTPEPTSYNDDYYNKDYKSEPEPKAEPKPEPKPEPKATKARVGYGGTKEKDSWSWSDDGYDYKSNGYDGGNSNDDRYDDASSDVWTDVDASSPAYLQEKCYQQSFVSITTATVMCLTENYIRVNFIEHYASKACGNPIEGPILYLRKLHGFIREVLDCTGDEASKNFPNLYRKFVTCDRTAYNPNAPFYLDSDKKVASYQYTSGAASGISAYTINCDHFMCGNPTEVAPIGKGDTKFDTSNAFVYLNVPSTTHYYLAEDLSGKDMYQTCKCSLANEKLGNKVYRYCQKAEYSSDKSLRSLYDSVHYVERATTALRRPLTIAEIAIRSAGVHEQPILEGFGIMYYCAFHACVANHDGDRSKCYPEFDSEKDWKLTGDISYATLKKKSKHVNQCIADGHLCNEDITDSDYVQTFNAALNMRSYLCLAENDIVQFFTRIYPGWDCENDASALVYGRHLADERCWADRTITKTDENETYQLCTPNSKLYADLLAALDDLISCCNKNKHKKKHHRSEPEPEPRRHHKHEGYSSKY